ncbi:peptidoglycan-binding protein [Streptomyces sp. NPDC005209]|uniref:peptidoglycan-binding domain-containing protein n=1 Tax=Streptomyces sp. NPDC005209 TaxID=3156715 RepID=UPI0033BB7512
MRGRTAASAALCVLVVGALCAGAARTEGERGPGGRVLLSDLHAVDLLESGRTAPNDVVGLWQAILWADGYLARHRVSCAYDGSTAVTTRAWQSNHHLSADGIVGPATWGAAAARLATAGHWTVYHGERYDLPLRRDANGALEVYDAGTFHRLRADAVTLTLCR